MTNDELVKRLRHRAKTDNGSKPVGGGDGYTYTLGYYDRSCAADDAEAADAITSLQADLKEAVEAHKRVVERSHNDPLGTSKVIDMRNISAAIVAKHEGKKG